jgi:hypothetical protein
MKTNSLAVGEQLWMPALSIAVRQVAHALHFDLKNGLCKNKRSTKRGQRAAVHYERRHKINEKIDD